MPSCTAFPACGRELLPNCASKCAQQEGAGSGSGPGLPHVCHWAHSGASMVPEPVQDGAGMGHWCSTGPVGLGVHAAPREHTHAPVSVCMGLCRFIQGK